MTVISTKVSGSPADYFTGSGQVLVVTYSGVLESTNNLAAIGSINDDCSIYNYGLVVGSSGHGLECFGARVDVVNGAEAFISSVSVYGSGFNLNNSGMIAGIKLDADEGVSADNAIIVNNVGASIVGRSNGIATFGGVTGLRVINSGTISGDYAIGQAASLVNNATGVIQGSFGVQFVQRLQNHGLIEATAGIAVALDVDATVRNTGSISASTVAIQAYGADAAHMIYNSGTIDAGTTAISLILASDDVTTINNSGEIFGRGAAIVVQNTRSVVLNNLGTIEGGVFLSGAVDVVRNAGEIIGDLLLGSGHDSFFGARGSVSGLLDGGSGNDRLYAGDGDTANGGAGNDFLSGSATESNLIGGTGADILRGGVGMDTFIYRLASESTATIQDVIRDFGYDDTIDLSAIDANTTVGGNQEFVFIDTNAFTGAARPDNLGEVRVVYTGNGAVLQADVNADGIVDFQVRLGGVNYLYPEALIL
jgi:hypothetical protein